MEYRGQLKQQIERQIASASGIIGFTQPNYTTIKLYHMKLETANLRPRIKAKNAFQCSGLSEPFHNCVNRTHRKKVHFKPGIKV